MRFSGEGRSKTILLIFAFCGLVIGLGLHFSGYSYGARLAWTIATLPVLATLLVEILRSLWRKEFGLDIVAAMSMTAALAFGEMLAASIVALMYTGEPFLKALPKGGHAVRCMPCCPVRRERQRVISMTISKRLPWIRFVRVTAS